MADLSADAYVKVWGKAYTDRWVLDDSTAQTVYKGQPMIIDQTADTVYLRGFVTATVVAATNIFVGIATHGAAVATADTETDNVIEVYTEPTIVGIPGATFDDSDVGDTMYFSDSGTLSGVATDNPVAGTLMRVRDGFQYVRLVSPAICTGA